METRTQWFSSITSDLSKIPSTYVTPEIISQEKSSSVPVFYTFVPQTPDIPAATTIKAYIIEYHIYLGDHPHRKKKISVRIFFARDQF